MKSINLKCKVITSELVALAVYTFKSTLSQSHLRLVGFLCLNMKAFYV